MTETVIRSTHVRLMEVHEGIREAFSGLDEEALRDIYTPEHVCEVVRNGDGYTLRAVPSCTDEMMDLVANTELVLIVGKFPYLGKNSEFNPHENLAEISSWRRYIRDLEEELAGTPPQKFSFWVWQNDSPVHGSSGGDAESNYKRLLCCSQELMPLIREQKAISRHLLTACKSWLRTQERELRVRVRWQPSKVLDCVLQRLQED